MQSEWRAGCLDCSSLQSLLLLRAGVWDRHLQEGCCGDPLDVFLLCSVSPEAHWAPVPFEAEKEGTINGDGFCF